jgi:hypothetical protein
VKYQAKAWDDYPDPVVDTGSGCLRWQGPHDRGGYGQFGRQKAHRAAWEREHGPIPEGMTIDHVRARGYVWKDCVLTAHMELVTLAENSRRSSLAVERRKRTHCPQNHPYTGRNLIEYRGRRYCRACINTRTAAHQRAKKENS